MTPQIKDIIENSFKQSNAGAAHFGQIIQALSGAGVESYKVDYRTGQTVYYMPNGDTLTLDLPVAEKDIAEDFNGDAIIAAIRGAQSGTVMYPEFKKLSQQAGCVGYTVWIKGRHVTYYGRCGETHIEHFPG